MTGEGPPPLEEAPPSLADVDAPPPRENEDADAPPPRESEDADAPPPRENEDADAPLPREDADAPPPRDDEDALPPREDDEDADAPPPREDEDAVALPPRENRDDPLPRKDANDLPPREDADAPPPHEDVDAPPPREDGDAPLPRKDAEVPLTGENGPEAESSPPITVTSVAKNGEISKKSLREQQRNAKYNALLAKEAEVEATRQKTKDKPKIEVEHEKEVEKVERPESQKKMLDRLHFSKSFWKKERVKHAGEEKEEKEGFTASKNVKATNFSKDTANDARTVWEAAKEGDVLFIKNYVQHKKWDVRRHDDRGGTGSTVLHIACWRSHIDLVQWLVEHVRRSRGQEAMETYVNCRDTLMNGVTPLMEAARTHIGTLNNRIEVLKVLINSGAKTHYKDSHGDTCLHWAARNGSMPIIKFLLHNTEGAVFTAMEDNYIHKRPIDVAYAVMEKRGDSSSKDTYNQLMNMMKGSNVRMKIQRLKMRTEREQQEKKNQIREDISRIQEEARIAQEAAEMEWIRQRSAAEDVRRKEEENHVQQAAAKGVTAAIAYMETREGKAEVKIKSRDIEREMREAAKMAGEKAGSKTSKVAFAKAQASFVKEKEAEAKKQAKRDFRRLNPSDFDKREYEAMERASQMAEKRYAKMLVDRDKQLRDDIDESSGMCSEPELNLNAYCKMYTGW